MYPSGYRQYGFIATHTPGTHDVQLHIGDVNELQIAQQDKQVIDSREGTMFHDYIYIENYETQFRGNNTCILKTAL